jgi:hypothetical protein
MKTIESLDLVLVTGGAPNLNTGDKAAGGTTNNDALLSTLNGISSSLKDLGKNQNQGPFSGTNGLMFVTMLALSQQRNNTVVYAGAPGYACGPRHGFRCRVW